MGITLRKNCDSCDQIVFEAKEFEGTMMLVITCHGCGTTYMFNLESVMAGVSAELAVEAVSQGKSEHSARN